MQERAARANGQEFSRSHTLLGLLLVAQRRFADAEPPFRKAIALRERSLRALHPDTGDALMNLASALFQQGKIDEATPFFERALRIFEMSRGPASPLVAYVLDGLAQIHERRDQCG